MAVARLAVVGKQSTVPRPVVRMRTESEGREVIDQILNGLALGVGFSAGSAAFAFVGGALSAWLHKRRAAK